jgi:hypothetical protein
MKTDLTLRLPRENEEDEFLRAHRGHFAGSPVFPAFYKEGMPFRRYLEVLAEQERGLNLAPDHVPSTFLLRSSE